MLKKFVVIALFITVVSSCTGFAFYSSVNDLIDRELADIEIENFDITEFKDNLLKEGRLPDVKDILNHIVNIITKETGSIVKTLVVLVVPVLLMGILNNISLNNKGVCEMANIAGYLAISGVVIYVFSDVTGISKQTVDEISRLSVCMIPVIYSIMLTMGKITGYTVMQPTVIFLTQTLILVIKNVIFPLTMLSFTLNITDNIAGGDKFKRVSDLISKISKWILIFLISVFTAILSAGNILTHSFDSVAMKGTKFVVANFIPVVGGAISEGAEAIGTSLILIKNATGIAGICGVLVMTFVPCIRIYLVSLMFYILSGISQAVSGEKIAKVLDNSGSTVSMLGATVLSVLFLFVISVAVMLTGGNNV